MTVSFVIPHWNQLPLLIGALASIERLSLPAGVRIETVVVDNGSTDGSADWAERRGVRVVRLPSNEGVSRAINRGILASLGEFVVLLNNDVELERRWLVHLLTALEDPHVWFATGKVLRHGDPSRVDGAGDAVCRGGAAWRIGHGRFDGPWCSEQRPTFFPSATAALFRREFFDRVGLLEEAFFAYLEDIDLGMRAALENLPGVYVPLAAALHRGSGTSGAWSAPMVRWMTSHQLLLLAKYYPATLFLRWASPILAAQLLWVFLAASRGRLRAWFGGFADGLRGARALRRSARPLRERSGALTVALERAETEIARVQRITGYDGFWKWYFRLAWPALHEEAGECG